MDPLLALARGRGLAVVEDACQAIGGRYKGRSVGTLGHLGCYGFIRNKAMACGGEGGAVASFDEAAVRRVIDLANHGRGERYHRAHANPDLGMARDAVGFNYRQSEILSAIARVQLRHLPGGSGRGGAWPTNTAT